MIGNYRNTKGTLFANCIQYNIVMVILLLGLWLLDMICPTSLQINVVSPIIDFSKPQKIQSYIFTPFGHILKFYTLRSGSYRRRGMDGSCPSPPPVIKWHQHLSLFCLMIGLKTYVVTVLLLKVIRHFSLNLKEALSNSNSTYWA